jgi:hypothetical protein
MLQPGEPSDSGNHRSNKRGSPNSSAKPSDSNKRAEDATNKKRDQFVDLMVLVHPREIDKATVRSLLAEAVDASTPEARADAKNQPGERLASALEAAGKAHPDDFSVVIAQALAALASGDAERARPVLERLNALVERTPLEPLAVGARANARQRAEAARQVPLWLVARACWKQNGAIAAPGLADKLAARSLEAARRQTENTTLLAMIREQGELALARGDRAGAQAAWGRMLELVVKPPEIKSKKPSAAPAAPPTAPRRPTQAGAANSRPHTGSMAPTRKTPLNILARFRDGSRRTGTSQPLRKAARSEPRPPKLSQSRLIRIAAIQAETQATKGAPDPRQPGAPRSKLAVPKGTSAAGRIRPGALQARPNLPILTLDRFEQAMQIARLAAAHDMPELSARAVREALRAGPPVVPVNPTATRRVIRSVGVVDEGPVDQVSPRVISNLMDLERLWQKQHVPPDLVYQALRDAVLPAGRPTEVFLYPLAIGNQAMRRPQSAGALLTAWAIRAGKDQDLKSAIAAREKMPLAELPAKVLSAQLTLAGSDPAQTKAALQALAARVKTDASRATSDLACQAALPALDRPEPALAKAALDVLDTAVKGFETSGQPEPLGTLLLLLARRQFQLGDAAGGGKRLEAYLEAMEKNTVRYGGDYALYLRKQQLERVAAEYARAGLWTDALAALARFVDAPAYSSGDPPIDNVLVRVLRKLETSPAQDRYKTLHDWTMPAKDRRVARILTSLATHDMAPDVFFRSESTGQLPAESIATKSDDTAVSTATALIEAARQAGSLDKLADEASAAASQKAGQKVENAEVLSLLVELARGNGAKVKSRIENRLAELKLENETHTTQRMATQSAAGAAAARFNQTERPVFPWPVFLVATAALGDADPAIAVLGESVMGALEERAKQTYAPHVLARLRGELVRAKVRRSSVPELLAADVAGWHPASSRTVNDLSGGMQRAVWIAHERHVAHLAGASTDYLLLDYPLTGTYEFSCDGFAGPWAESVLTHGGLAVMPFSVESGAAIAPVGQSELLNIPWRLTRLGNFNRITVQASPTKVRYLVNGHLFYEDEDPGPTAPWLGLLTYRERNSVWRGLTLAGRPEIPRAVKLSDTDRLEGWVSAFYNETQPPRRTDQTTDRWGNVVQVMASGTVLRGAIRGAGPRSKKARSPVNTEDYDWAAQGGVIHGRRAMPSAAPQRVRNVESPTGGTEAEQSLLSYFRPLLDGDVLTYDFLYEPGQVLVHPALGRLAFLLEPDGVKVHWMTTGGNDLSGLAADNSAMEPANRRGPSPIPLKPGGWNTIKLSLSGDSADLELNGQTVYVRKLEPAIGREFGLFHFKDQTAAEVKNVVLKGRWPERLSDEQLAHLVHPTPRMIGSDAQRRARHDLIGESTFALEAGEVVKKARALAPASAYELLAGWVLPSPDHPVLRLEGDFNPSFPAPDFGQKPTATASVGGRARVQVGGELDAPAIALVDAARSLGKLDELTARVEALKSDTNDHGALAARSRLALLGLIAIARGDDATAGKTLESIRALLEKLPIQEAEFTRWPEMCLATRALAQPALRDRCLALVNTMVTQVDARKPTEEETRTHPETWMRQVKHLRARLELLMASARRGKEAAPTFGSDPTEGSWAPVTQTRSQTRGEGYPIAHWTQQEKHLTHYCGHDRDLMYLATPLRGEFQLDCELSSRPGQVIRVAYGGLAVGPKQELTSLDRSQFGRPLPDIAINPQLAKLDDFYAFRLAVKGGRLTATVNGRKVHDAAAPADGDPWLTILSQGMENGTVRNLAITGNPTVPEKLNLSAMPDLAGWLADEYFEAMNGDNADWDKRGDEITGRLHEEAPGSKQESLLVYHRPMLEDGRIAYEFYYEPGKVMAHPALGRLAFLLEPDGVKVHRLTDGAYERSGLSPDNTHEEADNRRGAASLPLKARTWNRLILGVTGDRVTLDLNGQTIFERQIEPTNQRTFGLFHYADETQVRVRSVAYEGNWPRSPPLTLKGRGG